MNKLATFDAVIFYYWLPEEELSGIFTGHHRWWFMHGMAYSTCIFYGPTISTYKDRIVGPQRIIQIPLGAIEWSSVKYYLVSRRISQCPVMSIVVERGITPDPESVKSSGIPVQCLVADTHHMSNAITTAISYMAQISPIHISVSHSSHRDIFRDCLGVPAMPLVYSPRRVISKYQISHYGRKNSVSYYGNVEDAFHPERTYTMKSLLASPEGSKYIDCHPRMTPMKWQLSVAKDLATITGSLNGFPSVQSYVPLIYGTCLISDHLSAESDLGHLLKHGENCLLYDSPEEALEHIRLIRAREDLAEEIGRNGRIRLQKQGRSLSTLLASYQQTLADFAPRTGSQAAVNSEAMMACYIYEFIQDIHRLNSRIYVSINGSSSCIMFLTRYLRILPRVLIRERPSNQQWHVKEDGRESIIIETNMRSEHANKTSMTENIVMPSIENRIDRESIVRSGRNVDPNSLLDHLYEGARFKQDIPCNIRLSMLQESCKVAIRLDWMR